MHHMYNIMRTIVYFLHPPTCMCAQVVISCEPVPLVPCRMDAMPFMCVLIAAILLLLNTLLPR